MAQEYAWQTQPTFGSVANDPAPRSSELNAFLPEEYNKANMAIAPVEAPVTDAPLSKRVSVMHKMPALGLLDQLMANDDVHDIMVNGLQSIYVDAKNGMEDSGLRFSNEQELWNVAETIMSAVGQKWDPERPMIDTRLPDGSRVNMVAPPMAIDGISISIRKFPKHRITLDDMASRGQLTPAIVDFLKTVVGARLNIVIAGGTGSGKTTLMNALSAAISNKERIVTIEDAAELRLQQPHVVRLESKNDPNADRSVTIRDLVRNALRMRPDRIIVGESRGAEAMDVMQAMNTGHDGSMTTLHANTPRDALARLETMVTMANPLMPMRLVRNQIASTVNLIIQCNRTKNGQRRITYVSEISGMEGEMVVMQDLLLLKEDERTGQSEYRWVAGSSRNQVIMQAAQQAGLMRGLR